MNSEKERQMQLSKLQKIKENKQEIIKKIALDNFGKLDYKTEDFCENQYNFFVSNFENWIEENYPPTLYPRLNIHEKINYKSRERMFKRTTGTGGILRIVLKAVFSTERKKNAEVEARTFYAMINVKQDEIL